jgi:hypothetical protein
LTAGKRAAIIQATMDIIPEIITKIGSITMAIIEPLVPNLKLAKIFNQLSFF